MGIRVVPNETVPASVYKHLLPHERQVITVRFHPAVLIGPVAIVLAGLAVAGLLSTTVARHNGLAILVIWLLWLVLVLRLLYKVWVWLEDYFVVTSKRILLATGVFTRRVNMMPLSKVTDMRFERSAMGRVLGYGKFIVESAGQDQALRMVDHLPYPEQLYLEVCGLIFQPDKADADD
jgi:membrane protein YdbS with pleckstrin-like domain